MLYGAYRPDVSSCWLLSFIVNVAMSATGASVRLSLRVLKAKYLQKKGYLREQHGKLQKMRTAISQKEQELDEKNAERSSSFSSGSPLVPPSDSDSESGDSCGMESGARFSVSLWSLCFVEQSFVCRPRIASPT